MGIPLRNLDSIPIPPHYIDMFAAAFPVAYDAEFVVAPPTPAPPSPPGRPAVFSSSCIYTGLHCPLWHCPYRSVTSDCPAVIRLTRLVRPSSLQRDTETQSTLVYMVWPVCAQPMKSRPLLLERLTKALSTLSYIGFEYFEICQKAALARS